MKHIRIYEEYDPIFEDGFGKDYFQIEKVEKSLHYFFKTGEGDLARGFICKIGKFSSSSVIEEAENTYGVITIEEMNPNTMDDHLVNDAEYKTRADESFSLTDDELNKVLDITSQAIKDYLSKNPKVNKIYDECLNNIDMSPDSYKSIVFSRMDDWSHGQWSHQDGSNNKTILFSKRDHE